MRFLIAIIFSIFSLNSIAEEVIFEGMPVTRITINEGKSNKAILTLAQKIENKVKIVKEGDKYYWASRNMLELVPINSGLYVTYVAVTGAGYIRTLPLLRALVPYTDSKLSCENSLDNLLYFEHIVYQMGSITYYGC